MSTSGNHGSGSDGNIDDLARGAQDTLKKVGRDAMKVMDSIGGNGVDRAEKAVAFVQDQTHVALETLKDTVRDKPRLSMGIAAGAGLVLGLLLAARR
jgi:ElaB/YqjD/DUF883 family membrane-anchored ribosome-binding protein